MNFNFKTETKNLISEIKAADRKVIIVFLSVAVLQTISWYFTSRGFFRQNLVSFFPSDPNLPLIEYLYWFIGDFAMFFGMPLLIIKFLLKGNLPDFGIRIGDYKAGLTISGLFLIVMIIIIWFVSPVQSFTETYPHLKTARTSWDVFLIYETGMLLYMIGWEYIWRGFMLFGLEEKFGVYAVLIQMIPFLILHNGKPFAETLGAIPGGIALGILAFRTRSFIYCVLTHMGIMLSIDFISTLRFRAAEYGTGFDSLINILKSFF
ncbi:MAG: CPBP family intramembrane metalloprotease [Ignavibacteriaceae bacterium]